MSAINRKDSLRKDSSTTRKDSSVDIDNEGDVAMCGVCGEEVKVDHEALQCEFCSLWYHTKCEKVPKAVYTFLNTQAKKASGKSIFWFCSYNNCNGTAVQTLQAVQNLQILHKDFEERCTKLEAKVAELESNFQSRVYEEVQEALDRESRKRNIIIRNLPEASNVDPGDSGARDSSDFSGDVSLVKSMLTFMDLSNIEIMDVQRLGQSAHNRARLLRVTLKTVNMRRQVLQNAKLLGRGDSPFQRVFLSPDRTFKQQNLERQLRTELKERKEKGEKNLVIRGGKILVRLPVVQDGLQSPTQM